MDKKYFVFAFDTANDEALKFIEKTIRPFGRKLHEGVFFCGMKEHCKQRVCDEIEYRIRTSDTPDDYGRIHVFNVLDYDELPEKTKQ